MKILSIETSCDETSLALVEASGGLRTIHGELVKPPRFKVLKNLIASQIKIHRPFGGVVPNLAKREHLKNLPILYRQIFSGKRKVKSEKFALFSLPSSLISRIDLIAVTVGPGLEPALWTGIEFARQIHADLRGFTPLDNFVSNEASADKRRWRKEVMLIGANHLEGHLYSFLLSKSYSNVLKNIRIRNLFPAVALIVSGGHTILLLLKNLTMWRKLGETRDDAAGEAFDKVARLLGLPYPGGPEIEKLARRGNPEAINFPRPMMHTKNYDFSFSGLKTAVLYHLYHLRDLRDPKLRIHPNLQKVNSGHSDKFAVSDRVRADVAASFQQAAIDVLVYKTMRAAHEFGAKSVILCGGVAANKLLRKELKASARGGSAFGGKSYKLKANFLVPSFEYNTDNAAMIAAAGYIAHLRGKKLKLEAQGDMAI